jgi:hypothetical protein
MAGPDRRSSTVADAVMRLSRKAMFVVPPTKSAVHALRLRMRTHRPRRLRPGLWRASAETLPPTRPRNRALPPTHLRRDHRPHPRDGGLQEGRIGLRGEGGEEVGRASMLSGWFRHRQVVVLDNRNVFSLHRLLQGRIHSWTCRAKFRVCVLGTGFRGD